MPRSAPARTASHLPLSRRSRDNGRDVPGQEEDGAAMRARNATNAINQTSTATGLGGIRPAGSLAVPDIDTDADDIPDQAVLAVERSAATTGGAVELPQGRFLDREQS